MVVGELVNISRSFDDVSTPLVIRCSALVVGRVGLCFVVIFVVCSPLVVSYCVLVVFICCSVLLVVRCSVLLVVSCSALVAVKSVFTGLEVVGFVVNSSFVNTDSNVVTFSVIEFLVALLAKVKE